MAVYIRPRGTYGPIGEKVLWWKTPAGDYTRGPGPEALRSAIDESDVQFWQTGSFMGSLWMGVLEKDGYRRLGGVSLLQCPGSGYVVEVQPEGAEDSLYVTQGSSNHLLDAVVRGEPVKVRSQFVVSPDVAWAVTEWFYKTGKQLDLPEGSRWSEESPWVYEEEDLDGDEDE